ncbi:MAG: GHKL domain-containing protein [Christensenellales bacterium]|jgi:two-component system sensor histidine kinase AgrC
MWNIIEWAAQCIDIVLYFLFYLRCMPLKAGKNKTYVIAVVAACALLKMFIFMAGIGFGVYVSFLISVLMCFLLFKGKLNEYLVWVTLAITINGIVNFFVVNLCELYPGVTFQLTLQPGLPRMFCIIAVKILAFACYYIMTIRIDRYTEMNRKHSLQLFIVSVGCWAVLEVLLRIKLNMPVPEAFTYMGTISGMGLLFMLTTCISLYNAQVVQEKERTLLSVELHAAQITQGHIKQMKYLYTQFVEVRHDLANHLTVALGYCQRNDYKALESYLTKVTPVKTANITYTGNLIIDSLIASKMPTIKEHGIMYTFNLRVPEKLPINDVDLCILFANLLDNAFDAVSKLPDNIPKFIHASSKLTDVYWILLFENTSTSGSLYTVDSIPSTKRHDNEIHGIGTRQIKTIAEKTGGYVTFSQENGVFSSVIMLELPGV